MSQEPTVRPAEETSAAASVINEYANRLVLWIARHWLAIFNVAWATYVALPCLAPVFMAAGWYAPARLIYGLYSFLCHQLPDHSYFLYGPTPVPSAAELMAAGASPADDLLRFRSFIGDNGIGYKVALCERDIAIYAAVALAGGLFAMVRRFRVVTAPSLKVYVLFLIPIAIDGLTQLVGLRESNWWLRTLTGALFGGASVWLAYPYIEDAMQEVIETESPRPAPGPLST